MLGLFYKLQSTTIVITKAFIISKFRYQSLIIQRYNNSNTTKKAIKKLVDMNQVYGSIPKASVMARFFLQQEHLIELATLAFVTSPCHQVRCWLLLVGSCLRTSPNSFIFCR